MNEAVDIEHSRVAQAVSDLTAERLRLQKLIEQLRMSATGMLADAEQRLVERWTERAATLDAAAEPLVSIVIPVFNGLDATLRCLQSLADCWFEIHPVQIVVVDDASTDRTSVVVPRVPGISYLRRSSNEGFIAACADGAAAARGTYLCFLNNDTAVTPGWLDALVAAAQSDASAGAVGPKLVYPDRRLQQAGGVVWRDGTLTSYGRDGRADDPQYNFRREVDYCSSACLLVRRDVFVRAGGFDRRYAPAYYEDADLAFALRSLGYRVLYEPRSCVVHYEGLTIARDAATAERQQANRAALCAKWEQPLSRNFEYDSAKMHQAALARNGGQTVLVIGGRVPAYDRDARSQRLRSLMQMMRRARYNVMFLPDDYEAPQPYTSHLQTLGIEVLHRTQSGPSPRQALEAVLPSLDGAWMCTRDLLERYAPIIRMNGATRIFYDTAEDRYAGGDLQPPAQADVVVVTSHAERIALSGFSQVFVVPQVHDPLPKHAKFASSADVMFIGNYDSQENAEAAAWLCTEIMPRVWEQLPDVRVKLLGGGNGVQALASERVSVLGYVEDAAPIFRKSRVFAAPLRSARGMRGKVGHALTHGVPCVLTSAAAEDYELAGERDCLIADDAAAFATAIVRLYTDQLAWTRLSARSQWALKPFTTESVYPMLTTAIRCAFDSRASGRTVTA